MSDQVGDAVVHPGQWRLSQVQVHNWGTFSGLHTVAVARQGHLLAGESGSGKSSLLDAIATVLTPQRWLSYNLAAQDGGTSAAGSKDRSLLTYVRGAWRRERDDETGGTTATYLRPGATWSGIVLRYTDGEGHVVSLVRLVHAKAGATSNAELRQLHLILRREVTVADFAPHVKHGLNVRAIKAEFAGTGETVTDQHPVFTQRLRRVLGIGHGRIERDGENALLLLHRTQAARSLGSLDHLFRTFMLEEPRTFALADTAVEQFDNLDQAHERVVQSRRQVEVLRAAQAPAARYEAAVVQARGAQAQLEVLEEFHDQRLREMLERALEESLAERADRERAKEQAAAARHQARETRDAARREVDDQGGTSVALARRAVQEAQERAEGIRKQQERTTAQLASVGIDAPADAAGWDELLATARRQAEQATEARRRSEPERHTALQTQALARRAVTDLEEELASLRGRRSNLPQDLLRVRTWLAGELDLSEAALPYAGELIDVDPVHAAWQGAIERVLRPLATTLLVREEHLDAVLQATEGHHLGARLVFRSVSPTNVPPPPVRGDRSWCTGSASARTPSGWVQRELAERYDFTCVDSAGELRAVERGVTIAGQVTTGRTRYEKDDRHRVEDRRRWVLGTDNEEKREAIVAALEAARRQAEEADGVVAVLDERHQHQVRRITVLESLASIAWAEVDVDQAARRVDAARAEVDRLSAGNPDLARAREHLEEVEAELARAEREHEGASNELAVVAERVTAREEELRAVRARAARRAEQLGEPDPAAPEEDPGGAAIVRERAQEREEAWAALAERYRGVRRRESLESVRETKERVLSALHREVSQAEREGRESESAFEQFVRRLRAEFPALAPDLTVSIQDRAGWRAVCEQIEGTGLPEHEARFAEMLRTQSRQLVAQVLNELRGALRMVRERIDPVNASLSRSAFDRDRHLRIVPTERQSQQVTAFIEDLRAVADGSWQEEDRAAAETRFAVLRRVMARLGSGDSGDLAWKRRVLDTREHVTFTAQEIDADGRVANVHESGAGLSGGQRQKLVVFCLAAALRYQLTDGEESVPRYGTIVLDEAFDKADSTYTRMAMDVFVEFGFQMVLATPMKLLQTIEEYVGAITYVSCREFKSSSVGTVALRDAPLPEPSTLPEPSGQPERATARDGLDS